MIRVNTIYPAFMGEVNKFGIGAPCTFVRLSGCNIRCYKKTLGVLCDTPEALEVRSGKEMTEEDILVACENYGNPLICITGGEPLLQDIDKLIHDLYMGGFDVVVETNGTVDINRHRKNNFASFVIDFKCPSTGHMGGMVPGNFEGLMRGDFVKFVLYDEADYEVFKKEYHAHRGFMGMVAVGTFWGSRISNQWLLKKMQEDGISAYLNMQTHKMMCLYDKLRETDEVSKLFIPREL